MTEPLAFETDGGAGANGAFGLIVLQSDETMEVEFRPVFERAGVALYHARIPSAPDVSPASLAAMKQELPRGASLFPATGGLDVIAYACTSGATIIGPEQVEAAVRDIHPTTRVTNPITAAMAALETVKVRRIGFLTPYVAEVSAAMRSLLESNGFEIAAFGSFEQENEATVARITERSLLEAICRIGAPDEVEAVFASCTNLRSFGIIEEAEKRLGKPVITSNQALAWHMLTLGGQDISCVGPGNLFKHL
ncbi:Asp/Glu racemase [Minwuia sp.]|uniref:maleate cis-trans isomerase family protein n=1 Tax=Minwuia sp. TaxID=2493630 RepID=UPI003A8EF86E